MVRAVAEALTARAMGGVPVWFASRHAGVALLVAFAIVVMLLTSQQISDLRVAVQPLSRAMSWLEGLETPFDMDHVAFFVLVAAALRILLPEMRWWVLVFVLALLAGGTELLQFGTTGRTPKLLDARDDMLGAGIGLVLGSIPLWCAGQAPVLQRLSAGLLLAGVALLPLQQWPVATVFGFPVLACDLMFVAAIGVRGFAWATARAPMRFTGFHAWLALYLLAMLLAVLALPPLRGTVEANGFSCMMPSPSFGAALAKWVGIVYLAALALLVCDNASNAGIAKRLAMTWIAAACVVSLVSLAAVAGFYFARDAGWLQPLLNYHGSLPSGDYPRVRATFNYASMFAAYQLVALCSLLAARAAGWVRPRPFMLLAALLVLGCLPALTPEMAATPLALGVAGWWIWRGAAPRRARFALLAGLLPALLMLVVSTRSLVSPMELPSQRWRIWHDALMTIAMNPWSGVGPGQDVVGVAFRDPSGGDQWLTDAHNLWLSIAGQAGLPALFAFAAMTVWLLCKALGEASLRQDDGSHLRLGCALALACTVGYQGLTGSFEDARHLWVLIGLLAGTILACETRSALPASSS